VHRDVRWIRCVTWMTPALPSAHGRVSPPPRCEGERRRPRRVQIACDSGAITRDMQRPPTVVLQDFRWQGALRRAGPRPSRLFQIRPRRPTRASVTVRTSVAGNYCYHKLSGPTIKPISSVSTTSTLHWSGERSLNFNRRNSSGP
jgi:hypothetical protein